MANISSFTKQLSLIDNEIEWAYQGYLHNSTETPLRSFIKKLDYNTHMLLKLYRSRSSSSSQLVGGSSTPTSGFWD